MNAPHSLPLSFADLWEEFRAEIEDQARTYEEDGWDAHVFTVGEVRPASDLNAAESGAGPGLRVLLPDDQFDLLASQVGDGDRYTCETYRRAVREEAVFLLSVYLFEDSRTALFVPLYYRLADATEMIDTADEEGRLITQFRTLEENGVLSLEHTTPSLFLPE